MIANNAEGLILLNKSPGLTSFESLSFIKKALATRKAGHTGTLDKFASGLLLVLVGRAAKLASLFSFCKKEYLGCIKFGLETDTLDPEGEIVKEAEVPRRETVENVLENFRGEILQSPPAYSAIHINGKRAHELSRQGLVPEMKKRPCTIYQLELVSWEPPFASVRVVCSSGTYIRSLARDIALAAGSCAHLTALERSRIGAFSLTEALMPLAGAGSNAVTDALRPITPDVFTALGLPSIHVEDKKIQALVHGQALNGPLLKELVESLPAAPAAGIFSKKNNLIASLERKNNAWHYGHVFTQ